MKTKFRCWDELKGKMYFWTLNDLLCRFDVDTGYNEDDRPSTFFEWMQYTGLRDKNGKEIYEGDIVKVPNDWEGYGWMAGEIREVYFCDGAFRLKPKHNPQINRGDRGCHIEDDMDKCEIIGNIYENPELLK